MAEKISSFIISGKRKTAVAKLRIQAGSGVVYYNQLPHTELTLFHRLALLEPLKIHEREVGPVKYNFMLKTRGGGKEAQIQAARLAIAKALVHLSGSEVLRKSYLTYDRNMLVADSRRKEANKPGDSAPRSKRQKSYR